MLLERFFATAGLFVLLNAHFIAAVQILVYAGAIMVLFLFVVMLLNLKRTQEEFSKLMMLKIYGLVVGVFFLFEILSMAFKIGFYPFSVTPIWLRNFCCFRSFVRQAFSFFTMIYGYGW